MRRIFLLCLSATLLLLAGCPRAPVVESPSVPPVPVPAPPVTGARIHDIDQQISRVDILVYRAGTMARLGHNHVLTSRTLQGRAWVHEELARSGFEVRLPVESLIVDDEEARLAAGEDFRAEVADKDKQGARANMLRDDVLDAAQFPEVLLRSVRVSGELPELTVTTAVTLKDVTREIDVPTHVVVSNDTLRATGEFMLRQTEFGIKPFSVAMGAVQVADELRIRFDLHARVTSN